MKNSMIIYVAFAALILIIGSEAINNNDDQLFESEKRELNKEDEFGDFQDDNNSGEVIEIDRRGSSNCEPCGLRRIPCCFPNLCQHRNGKTSKCLRARG